MITLTHGLDTNTRTFRPGHGKRIVRYGARPDPGPETLPVVYLDSLAEESWFWTEFWQGKERIAEQEIAAGKGITFGSVDELIEYLNR